MSIKTREISSIKMVLKPTFEAATEIHPVLGASLLTRALPGDLPVLPSISSISLCEKARSLSDLATEEVSSEEESSFESVCKSANDLTSEDALVNDLSKSEDDLSDCSFGFDSDQTEIHSRVEQQATDNGKVQLCD